MEKNIENEMEAGIKSNGKENGTLNGNWDRKIKWKLGLNQMEKKMEDDIETGIIGIIGSGYIVGPSNYGKYDGSITNSLAPDMTYLKAFDVTHATQHNYIGELEGLLERKPHALNPKPTVEILRSLQSSLSGRIA